MEIPVKHDSYFTLKVLAFENPLHVRISIDPLLGGYGSFCGTIQSLQMWLWELNLQDIKSRKKSQNDPNICFKNTIP